jgi:predicted nucleotide-binding protein
MKIFIASAGAARKQVEHICNQCEKDGITLLPWWKYFKPGTTTYDQLLNGKEEVGGAIIVLTPEHKTKIKRRQCYLPNANVLFEFGLFVATFTTKNVLALKFGKVDLPSNFDGYNHLTASKKFVRKGEPLTEELRKKIYDWLPTIHAPSVAVFRSQNRNRETGFGRRYGAVPMRVSSDRNTNDLY